VYENISSLSIHGYLSKTYLVGELGEAHHSPLLSLLLSKYVVVENLENEATSGDEVAGSLCHTP
jgi:hypothetical protein